MVDLEVRDPTGLNEHIQVRSTPIFHEQTNNHHLLKVYSRVFYYEALTKE